jgi:hypothetical protein
MGLLSVLLCHCAKYWAIVRRVKVNEKGQCRNGANNAQIIGYNAHQVGNNAH